MSIDPGVTGRQSFTIDEWCFANGLSRSMYYKLLRQGRAPRLMYVGKTVRISSEAAAEWRRAMEAAATRTGPAAA